MKIWRQITTRVPDSTKVLAEFSVEETNAMVSCLKIMLDNYDFPIMLELENKLSQFTYPEFGKEN